MKGKNCLVAFLLAVGFCFVPALGYGEVKQQPEVSVMDLYLLKEFDLLRARVDYMMCNPTNFLNVNFYYDPEGTHRKIFELPEGVDTKGKIFVKVQDNRDIFSYESGTALLDQFKGKLETIYSFLTLPTMGDMNADIVAMFCNREGIPLGYFYQGEYQRLK